MEIAIARTSSPAASSIVSSTRSRSSGNSSSIVSPHSIDEHVIAATELLQPEIDDILDAVEPVDVDVRQVERCPSTP